MIAAARCVKIGLPRAGTSAHPASPKRAGNDAAGRAPVRACGASGVRRIEARAAHRGDRACREAPPRNEHLAPRRERRRRSPASLAFPVARPQAATHSPPARRRIRSTAATNALPRPPFLAGQPQPSIVFTSTDSSASRRSRHRLHDFEHHR
jgi:hypothetical protein